jgi:hypothetical protein
VADMFRSRAERLHDDASPLQKNKRTE